MANGYLTTHVLDTARGEPAAGMKIDLYRKAPKGWDHVCTKITNADGRTETPLIPNEAFETGEYELLFHAGAYLKTLGALAEAPMFLDEIPIRFGISDAERHYHVPLLLSPFGYSTYRGS